jgi:LSD1 subclass zinc finger protein
MTDNQVQCVKCRGRSIVYLCPLCITELRRQLLRIPTLVDYLRDAELGQTKLEDQQVRYSDMYHYVKSNPKAAALADEIETIIGQWARPLAVKGGYVISPPVTWHRPIDQYVHTVNDYSVFLAAHAAELAKDPDVGELTTALRALVRRAIGGRDHGGIVNRRIPPQFCGPCPTTITDHRRCEDCKNRSHECGRHLMAPRGAVEVTCGSCGATHGVQRLVTHLLARADDYRGTITEIHLVLKMLGTPVHIDTLYEWAKPKVGKLQPAGYLREDGRRIAPTRHSEKDKPVYRFADARKARENAAKRGRRGRPLKHAKTEGSQEK